MTESAPHYRRWLKTAIKLLIVGLMIWFVRATLAQAWHEIQGKKITLNWPWLAVSAACYLLGQVPAGWFWHRLLMVMGQPSRVYPTFRAYFIGHLGKYVPGKALVVLLRAALVKPFGVDAAVASIAVFVETLTMMAVGAAVAAVVIGIAYHENWQLLAISVGLFFAAGAPAVPPVFRLILHTLRVGRAYPHAVAMLDRVRASVLVPGWFVLTVGWFLQGLGLWATLRAMGIEDLDLATYLPLLTATVALAIVAGFASLIPGGFGVRDMILTELLTKLPGVSTGMALLSAIVLRLVTVVAELGISAILYSIRPAPPPAP